MGTAKRYADKIGRQINDRIFRGITESGPLMSLGREERELDARSVTKTP